MIYIGKTKPTSEKDLLKVSKWSVDTGKFNWQTILKTVLFENADVAIERLSSETLKTETEGKHKRKVFNWRIERKQNKRAGMFIRWANA